MARLVPLTISSKKYFQKKRYEDAIIEYEAVKKIIYIEVPILIIVNIVDNFNLYPDLNLFINNLSVNLIYSVTAAFIWIGIQTRRKDYKFYLAKAYIKASL